MVELGQEVVSIGVILLVCVSLSISCLVLWMVRCRRDQLRHREGKDVRQRELDSFEDNKKPKLSPTGKRKIHEGKKDEPKKAETDAEKGKKDKEWDKKEPKRSGTVASQDETMKQFETRIRAMETINEVDSPATRSKRLDTVSIIATGSSETLQRNDSKANMFPVERSVEEMDLNPGLNGSINLDMI